MTEHRIYVPETGEKIRAAMRQIAAAPNGELIEGKKIFSKAKTTPSRYFIPAEYFDEIQKHPDCWLFCEYSVVFLSKKRPQYAKLPIVGEVVIIPGLEEKDDFRCLGFEYIPEGQIVACSDVLKYGRVVYE